MSLCDHVEAVETHCCLFCGSLDVQDLSSLQLLIEPCFLWTVETLVFLIFLKSFYSQHVSFSQQVTNGETHNELLNLTLLNKGLEQKTKNTPLSDSCWNLPLFLEPSVCSHRQPNYAKKHTTASASVHSQEQNRLPANATKTIKAEVCVFCSTSRTK